jgi:hypothetical protein
MNFKQYFFKESNNIDNPFKKGINLNVNAGPSVIVKSLMDEEGIAYILLKTLDDSIQHKATIMQRDLEAEQNVGQSLYPSYEMAEQKFEELINKVSKYPTLTEAIKVPFGGYEDYKGKAKVYVNLKASIPKERKLVYSIQGRVPVPNSKRKSNKVIGYNNQLMLGDVKFTIGETKWKQVQTDGGRKNVHSMVVGDILNEEPKKLPIYVTYDPRKYRYFVRFENGNAIPIKAASKVAFNPDGLTAEGVVDMEPSEIRAEGPLLTPEETYYMQRRREELKQQRLMERRKKRLLKQNENIK